MSDLNVKHDYAFKRPIMHVKDGGIWKPVVTEYVKDGGVWKPVWTAPGAQLFVAGAATTFTVPAHVHSICVAAISAGLEGQPGGAYDFNGGGPGGDGGDGGSLAYVNNLSVTPGQTFTVSGLSGRTNFGSRYVNNGRGGFSAGWDTSYFGGTGGLGQQPVGTQSMGYPGGEGGWAATWISAGRAGGNAPGTGAYGLAYGGQGVDVFGILRTQGGVNYAGNGSNALAGDNGAAYGGGGGGGSGQIYAGAGPFAGGAPGGGAVRIIWGTGKSFPDNANF